MTPVNAIERLRNWACANPDCGAEWGKHLADVAAVDALHQADREAVELLDGCLNDDRAWDGEELVALMERVRESLAAAVRRVEGQA